MSYKALKYFSGGKETLKVETIKGRTPFRWVLKSKDYSKCSTNNTSTNHKHDD